MTDLRTGFTTGTCAAAAAKAAAIGLGDASLPESVSILLPDGDRVSLSIVGGECIGDRSVRAMVVKDAGDDPDITDGCRVVVTVERMAEGDIEFIAGTGVGTVTKPGLQIPPGGPAINPAPREMIRQAIREVLSDPVRVTVSIENGEALAEKTFNPKLGVVGGLSILGTSGRVRPFSHEALQASLICALDIANAAGIRYPVLVPGHIGARAARRYYTLADEQVVEVSNEWGYMLEETARRKMRRPLLVGHPGKLAKLAMGYWDTHSARSPSALPFVQEATGTPPASAAEITTVEGWFAAISKTERDALGSSLAERICTTVNETYTLECAVLLIAMNGDMLGRAGDLTPWTPTEF